MKMSYSNCARARTSALLGVLVILVVFVRPAYGYIDPGSGSLLIQVVIGSALACLLGLKVFWRQVTAFLARLFGRKTKPPERLREGGTRADDDE
jgi:hypothetical protein